MTQSLERESTHSPQGHVTGPWGAIIEEDQLRLHLIRMVTVVGSRPLCFPSLPASTLQNTSDFYLQNVSLLIMVGAMGREPMILQRNLRETPGHKSLAGGSGVGMRHMCLCFLGPFGDSVGTHTG